jgi:hypothetical protein
MSSFFREIYLPKLLEIKEELYKEIPKGNTTQSKSFNLVDSEKKFPTLINYVKLISKIPLNEKSTVKIFVTAPKNKGLIHIDDITTSRIGLNIPILGCKSTEFIFYTSEENNFKEKLSDTSKGYGISLIPKNFLLLKKVESLELLSPYLVRTDVFHQAINLTNNFRIIATVRWEPFRHLNNFNDFIKD